MNYPVTPTDENNLIRELSMPIYEAKGWLKFLGVLSIVGGILQALSIVGILVAWLPIWMGMLMYQAASNIETAYLGDRLGFLRSLGSLKTYFVLQGVLTLLAIVFSLLTLCLVFVLPLLGIMTIPWDQMR